MSHPPAVAVHGSCVCLRPLAPHVCVTWWLYVAYRHAYIKFKRAMETVTFTWLLLRSTVAMGLRIVLQKVELVRTRAAREPYLKRPPHTEPRHGSATQMHPQRWGSPQTASTLEVSQCCAHASPECPEQLASYSPVATTPWHAHTRCACLTSTSTEPGRQGALQGQRDIPRPFFGRWTLHTHATPAIRLPVPADLEQSQGTV